MSRGTAGPTPGRFVLRTASARLPGVRERDLSFVMPRLHPGLHEPTQRKHLYGSWRGTSSRLAGPSASKATPFFERLCPPMTPCWLLRPRDAGGHMDQPALHELANTFMRARRSG